MKAEPWWPEMEEKSVFPDFTAEAEIRQWFSSVALSLDQQCQPGAFYTYQVGASGGRSSKCLFPGPLLGDPEARWLEISGLIPVLTAGGLT